MANHFPVLDSAIVAQVPWADGSLHPDLKHCVIPIEEFDLLAAERAVWAKVGGRPRLQVSPGARALQLVLSLWSHDGLADQRSSYSLAVSRGLGLEKAIRDRGRAGSVVLNDARREAGEHVDDDQLARNIDRSERTLFNIRGEQQFADERTALAAHIASEPDRLFGTTHYADAWAPDSDAVAVLALKTIAHIRGAGQVAVEDRQLVHDLLDLCFWRGEVAPEPLVSAMAYVSGVLDASGQPVDAALQLLWGARHVGHFRRCARDDAMWLAFADRPFPPDDPDEPDRSVSTYRSLPAYWSLVAEAQAGLTAADRETFEHLLERRREEQLARREEQRRYRDIRNS